jgi:zinc transport system substrate-binding protein
MKRLYVFLLFSTCFLFFSCSSKEERSSCDVLVSVPPYLYFIEQLTSGQLTALSLVPDGANPHIYEPSPKEVEKAHQAKVWIRLSESFEKKIYKSLRAQNKNLIIVNLAEDISLPSLSDEIELCSGDSHTHCSHGHCHHCSNSDSRECKDLHIWLSLRLAQEQAALIAKALIQAYPDKKELIETNLKHLNESFQSTDALFATHLAPYKGDSILVSHPAFGYFCHDYGLSQLSIEHEGKDPLPNRITSLLDCAKKKQIRVVLTQAQYNNKGAEMIGKKLELPIHEIDPYSKDYLTNMNYLAHVIADPR